MAARRPTGEEDPLRPDDPRSPGRSPWWVLAAAAVAVVVAVAVTVAASGQPDRGAPGERPRLPYRAFEADSWWNSPLPADTPVDPYGDRILDYLSTAPESGRGCLMLAGARGSHWGTPTYWARRSDPTYRVTGVEGPQLPELSDLRIPTDAEPASNNDGSMSIFDRHRGYVVALTDAEYHASSDTWTASGATVTYLRSNGLHVGTGLSDDPRNRGTHRGNNGATMAVSWDEVRAGAIRHVLKIAAGPEVSHQFVFPMVGSDGDYRGDDPAVPPQGLRLRIKPSVDVAALGLDAEAAVIVRALQRYGAYIGDSGGTTALKLENTRAEGRGQLWTIAPDALCDLPFTSDYWQVVAPGYDPSRPTAPLEGTGR